MVKLFKKFIFVPELICYNLSRYRSNHFDATTLAKRPEPKLIRKPVYRLFHFFFLLKNSISVFHIKNRVISVLATNTVGQMTRNEKEKK